MDCKLRYNRESVGSGESLDDGEADFVDSVGEVIDLVGVVVVRDNGEGTGGDTEGGVHIILKLLMASLIITKL